MTIQTAFSTLACPDWSWQELLANGKAAEFDGVEIRLLQRETDLLARDEFQPAHRAQRRTELQDAGFRVCGLASSVRFDYPSAQEREEQLQIGSGYLELASELGAGFVRVFGDAFPEGADEETRRQIIRQVADGLTRLGDIAGERGHGIVIETHGDFADSRVMQAAMEQVRSSAVGVLWDTHHPWRFYGEPLAETFARLRPWVRHTHWKDSVTRPSHISSAEGSAAEQAARQLMSGHRPADYVLFGGGEFPIVECLRLLRGAGYDGWFSYEWEKAWHPEIEDPEIALPLFPRKLREFWQLLNHS